MRDTAHHHETARHRDAFEAWYEADRDFGRTCQNLSINDRTLRHWADWFGWRSRADERDAEVERRNAKAAIKRKAEMVERHRKGAELLHKRGVEYFARNAIADERAAIQAVKVGSELERTAEGMPAWAVALMGMDDAELAEYIAAATGTLAAGDGDPVGEGAGSADPAPANARDDE